MFEISDLKAMKLPELQKIAENLKVPKYKTQKKLDLVYQILDLQASNPKIVKETAAVVENTTAAERPKEHAPKPRPRPRKVAASESKDPKAAQQKERLKEKRPPLRPPKNILRRSTQKKSTSKRNILRKNIPGTNPKDRAPISHTIKITGRRKSRATTTRILKTSTNNRNTNSTVS